MLISNTIEKLDNNPLVYRSILTIPQKTNIGIEIEMEDVLFGKVESLIKREFTEEFVVKIDKSLKKDANAEIALPVLQNTKETWILLKKLAILLERLNPTYNNCSFQINFDGTLLPTEKEKIRFIKLYAMYEDIVYRFSKGEDEKYRESLEKYASPIILSFKGIKNFSPQGIIDFYSNNKRYGLVFKNNGNNLIEFRTPNATHNPILWQNYITFFYYLLKFASSKKYNEKEIDEYIDRFMKFYILESYERMNTEKALKLANMIFKDKNDQIQFLHQYLKR